MYTTVAKYLLPHYCEEMEYEDANHFLASVCGTPWTEDTPYKRTQRSKLIM